MEMNTRLQVEHGITELVTGIDLVEQQLRVAAGEPLSFTQQDVKVDGHAIEARIYAENPSQGFVPTGGRVLTLREADGEGIRVDSSLVAGSLVGTMYDPMLSKVMARGHDRATALARLDRALDQTVVLGFPTNVNFLRALVRHPDVQSGRLDTGLVERELSRLTSAVPPTEAYVAFALDRLLRLYPEGPITDRWDIPDGWRLGGVAAPISWRLSGPEGDCLLVEVIGRPSNAEVVIDGSPVSAAADQTSAGLLLTIGNRTRLAAVATEGDTTWVWVDGETFSLTEISPESDGLDAGSDTNEVRSPMPGTIIAVKIRPGDTVEKGDPLLIVEAMKMEYTLVAPRAGSIAKVLANLGESVLYDAILIHFDSLSEEIH